MKFLLRLLPPSKNMKLSKVGDISEEYCLQYMSGTEGLMDEVIRKAETKNNIDYIKYPSFSKTDGHNCVQLSGEGYRLVK